MTGYIHRRHIVTRNTILSTNIDSLPNNNLESSFQLCIIKISNKYFIPIKDTGIECLHESTYL